RQPSEPKHCARFLPGRWGKIPPPRLAEEYLHLEPRLRGLEENVLERLYIFRTRRNPLRERPQEKQNQKSFALKKMISRSGWIFVTRFPWLMPLLYITFFGTSLPLQLEWVTIVIIVVFVLVLGPRGLGLADYFKGDLFSVVKNHIGDLRALPITGDDYAIAHWGGRLLHDRKWRMFPALALEACRAELQFRLERHTGWSYYPSTFDLRLTDKLSRGELPTDGDGRPVFGDEFALAPDAYNYTERLNYLAALWREYLEVWQPDQPAEAAERIATVPSRARRRVEEIGKKK
ncbi:hypothetical protein HY256_02165, partial [Candidatus Sumerlaeota bacterium]|nr:hypothetical protein [Candidatus Sumerlaeota bacterium]